MTSPWISPSADFPWASGFIFRNKIKEQRKPFFDRINGINRIENQCFAMVWQLTQNAWAFMGEPIDQQGSQIHIERVGSSG